MKRILVAGLLVLLCSGISFGQEVISTQGESHANASGSIDFTIGEPVIFTGTDGSNDITQGLHQTNWNFAEIEDHIPSMEVSVYPNPLQEQLIVETSEYSDVSYSMYDGTGRIVATGPLESSQTNVDVLNFEPGPYQLVLTQNNNQLKVFKLIKNQ